MVWRQVALKGTFKIIILVLGKRVVRTLCNLGNWSTSTWVTAPSAALLPSFPGFRMGILSPWDFLGVGDCWGDFLWPISHWSMNKSVTLSSSTVKPHTKWFNVFDSLFTPSITRWLVVADWNKPHHVSYHY